MDVPRLRRAGHASISQLSHPAPTGSCAPSLFPKAAPRHGTRAQAWMPCQLPAPFTALFIPKPKLRLSGKNRVRASVTRGGNGDKERGHKPHYTPRERNQPSAGKRLLMGVCALVPAKAKPQNHVHQTNNALVTLMPPAPAPPGSHGPVAAFQQGSQHSGQQQAPVQPHGAPAGGENICCSSLFLILLPALTHSNSKLNPEAQ